MILHHRIHGEGKPLLILHGLFGTSDNWQTVVKTLAGDYKIIVADLRNHGRSFHDEAFNYEIMAEDVRKLLDELGVHKVSIIGHSMGGKVAMQFAADHEEYLEKLMVLDIGPKVYPVRHDWIIKSLEALPIREISGRGEVEKELAAYIEEQGVRLFLLKNLQRNPEGGFRWKMNLPVISREIEEVGMGLEADHPILVPTVFVRGGDSDYILDEDWDEIQEAFPNSTLITFHGAGHWLHVDSTEALVREIREFI